jgi:hypothetical protein
VGAFHSYDVRAVSALHKPRAFGTPETTQARRKIQGLKVISVALEKFLD